MQLMPNDTGWIEVICGPMFSGKTEELIRRLRRALYGRQKVQAFKPKIDTRYDEIAIVSHSNRFQVAALMTDYDRPGIFHTTGARRRVTNMPDATVRLRETRAGIREHLAYLAHLNPTGDLTLGIVYRHARTLLSSMLQ